MLKQEKIKKVNNVDILIISNSLDFTTDYVCLELDNRKAKYLRLNRDQFNKYQVVCDVGAGTITVEMDNVVYFISQPSLKAIYYRAPIYLRDNYKPGLDERQQLFRTQWTAFIRNLAIFEDIIWVNNPVATFKAENKILQLKYAYNVGFLCPKTVVTNTNAIDLQTNREYIVKSLDTAVLRIGDKEAFVYSNKMQESEIKNSLLELAPVIVQEYINPKIDVRVTVVGETVYTVRIFSKGKGVDGDWRKLKQDLDFIPFCLPPEIEQKCVDLIKLLGLSFGAIDLIESKSDYYFIEVNPTGEWAWLVETAKLKIYKGIVDFLEGKR